MFFLCCDKDFEKIRTFKWKQETYPPILSIENILSISIVGIIDFSNLFNKIKVQSKIFVDKTEFFIENEKKINLNKSWISTTKRIHCQKGKK